MIRKESQTPVTGLQKIIEDTRRIDYRKIANFFNITYDGEYKKVLLNRFTAEEAISFFLAFFPNRENDFDFFIKLFTYQGE